MTQEQNKEVLSLYKEFWDKRWVVNVASEIANDPYPYILKTYTNEEIEILVLNRVIQQQVKLISEEKKKLSETEKEFKSNFEKLKKDYEKLSEEKEKISRMLLDTPWFKRYYLSYLKYNFLRRNFFQIFTMFFMAKKEAYKVNNEWLKEEINKK
jgi:hypothetical protein